jgi:predicted nucleotidyltransferase
MSIASSLFSPSQERVIRWLFGQPERSYYLSELRRLTGLGSASIQRELNRLSESQLVTSERVGNLRRFQANPSSPVFEELVSLTRKTMGAEPLIREALQPLKKQVKAAWIYGSVAKQTDKAGSDIDVMVVGDKIRMEELFKALIPLEQQLGRKISPTCYTQAEFKKRRAEPGSFVNRVLAQPLIPLLGDTPEPTGAG